MKKAFYLLPLGGFLALAVFLGRGLQLDPREVPSPLIGKPAPAFEAPTLADPARVLNKASFQGRVWILNVYASWCAACVDEHPVLVQWMKTRSGKPATLIGLNYKDQREAAQGWLGKLGNPYTDSIFDEKGRIGIDFGVYGVPETFVIDQAGQVRWKHIGPLTPEVLANELDPLLKVLDV